MSSKISRYLESILMSSFGEDALVGIVVELLEEVTPQQLYLYIKDKKLLDWKLQELAKYQKHIKYLEVKKILTVDYILGKLQEHRPDLVSLVLNSPNGASWLQTQIDEVKRSLHIIPTS